MVMDKNCIAMLAASRFSLMIISSLWRQLEMWMDGYCKSFLDSSDVAFSRKLARLISKICVY